MSNREMFSRMGGWEQLLFLVLISFAGFIVAAFTILVIAIPFTLDGGMVSIMESAPFLKIAQTIQTIGWLLIPAIGFAYLFYNNPKSFFKAEKYPTWQSVLFVIVIFISIQPFIQLVGYYNQQMMLPEFMSGLEEWMRSLEADAEKTINLLIADRSVIGIITNLFVIAILAGVTEELFFRGCMQQVINKIVYNKHIAIWITAIIFSAIHFQFFGFLPRMLLGALLGYLFVWSNNIWIPIIGHIANNGMYTILAQYYYGTPEYEKLDKFDATNYWWVALVSILVSGILLYIYNRKFTDKNLIT